jgi:hypothetical protein
MNEPAKTGPEPAKVTRRRFLGWTGAVAAGGFLAHHRPGHGGPPPPPPPPPTGFYTELYKQTY